MKMQIKQRFSGKILFECDAENMRSAVERAVEEGADLACANLSGVDLTGADLPYSDLTRLDY